MNLDRNQPALIVRDRVFQIIVGEPDVYQHSFGGGAVSLDPAISQEALRHVFTLDLSDARLGFEGAAAGLLPLLYCFESAGRVQYSYSEERGLEILEMTDYPLDPDFPYPDYPRDFPVFPVRLEEVNYDDFNEVIGSYAYSANLEYREDAVFDPWTHCYVIAVPCEKYGVSLWGEDGDAEMVEAAFAIDLNTRAVTADQGCS